MNETEGIRKVQETNIAPRQDVKRIIDGFLCCLKQALKDGETVKIPAVWYGMPVVVPVAVMAESTAISGVKFGALDMREAQDSAGAGTGEWSFRAAGTFTWAAMGYARMFLTANGGNNG